MWVKSSHDIIKKSLSFGGSLLQNSQQKKAKINDNWKNYEWSENSSSKGQIFGWSFVCFVLHTLWKAKKKMMINHIPEELTRNAYLCISSFSCVSLFTNTWKENYICINCTLLTFHLYYNNILQHTIQLRSNQAKAMANNNNSGLCGSRCNVMWFSFSHSFALLL